ncbi:MAG: glutamate synthase [Acidobacteria bacterium]|nr:MAG: glutamate synthase [Acidobacteriota bacterium]
MQKTVPALTPEEFAARFSDLHPPFARQEAVVEASRCLFCFDAPCTAACPTHIDVPRFIKKIATGNLRGSALTILDSNLLGLSCSRVCPVDVLCEGACVMHRYNKQPIEIGRLQRAAMDWFYAHNPSLPVAPENRAKRVACIGAGPASLACAAELRRRGYPAVIFDRNPLPGGLNTYGIAEYKLRPPDSLKEVELVRSMGVEFRLGVEAFAKIEAIECEFDAIFLGIGLGPTHRLGIPGEDLPGFIDALRFIADYKTSSIPVGRRVVVIGAGNTAIDAATAAKRLGAQEIHIVYRRGEAEMPAFEYEYEIAKLDGIVFHWWTQVKRIHGSESVESIECARPDGTIFNLACDMVIPAIGQSRLVDFLARCRGVEVREGRVVINRETGQTENRKYFAGGDCVNGGREVVDAAADGKRAGIGIAQWLEADHG